MGSTVLDVTETDLPDTWAIKEDSGLKGIEVVDEEKGIVQAFVSVTGVKDRVGDIIHPGAYAKSLATRTPKGLVGHDWKQLVGKALEVKELMPGDAMLPDTLSNGDPWPSDAGALYVKSQYNLATQRGREAYEDALFFKDQQEWSIGYSVNPKNATKDAKGTRHIKELDLFEYSQVLWGAMPHARTSSVKEDDIEIETKDGAKKLSKPVTMPDGSFPIDDLHSLKSAVNLWGHSKHPDEAKKHIKRCAAMLGATDQLPDNWGDKNDASTTENKDQISPISQLGDALPVLHEKTGKNEGTVELDLAVKAFQALGAFLHSQGAIDDDLATKVAGDFIEAKSFECMLDVAESADFLGDDLAQFKVLAGQYDFAIESGQTDLMSKAESKVADFLRGVQTNDPSLIDDVKDIASAMISLREVDEPEESESKDDQPEDQEVKAEPVVMTKEEFDAFLGR